ERRPPRRNFGECCSTKSPESQGGPGPKNTTERHCLLRIYSLSVSFSLLVPLLLFCATLRRVGHGDRRMALRSIALLLLLRKLRLSTAITTGGALEFAPLSDCVRLH